LGMTEIFLLELDKFLLRSHLTPYGQVDLLIILFNILNCIFFLCNLPLRGGSAMYHYLDSSPLTYRVGSYRPRD